MRSIKTPEELEKIKAAQKITDAAFTYILGKIRPGVTEREIALELEFYMRRQARTAWRLTLLSSPVKTDRCAMAFLPAVP